MERKRNPGSCHERRPSRIALRSIRATDWHTRIDISKAWLRPARPAPDIAPLLPCRARASSAQDRTRHPWKDGFALCSKDAIRL